MKRNLDLLRDIMLKIEASDRTTSIASFSDNDSDYPTISFHIHLLLDNHFINADILYGFCGGIDDFKIIRLTSEGCDYLDNIRNNSVWTKVKERLAAIGGSASLAAVKMIADGIIAAKIAGLVAP